jgi:methylmalonic aciduria homocystinuria type C protein
VIGNTRALWPRFLDAARADSALLEREDPLDGYVETVVNDACAGLSARWQCFMAHGSRWLAIQRLAQRAGLAYLSPGHLSVHPTFGPWIALRAVIVSTSTVRTAQHRQCPRHVTSARRAASRRSPARRLPWPNR